MADPLLLQRCTLGSQRRQAPLCQPVARVSTLSAPFFQPVAMHAVRIRQCSRAPSGGSCHDCSCAQEAMRAVAAWPHGALLPTSVVDLLLDVFEAAMLKAPSLEAARVVFEDLKVRGPRSV